MQLWKIVLILIILLAGTIRVYTAIGCDTVPDYSDMATYNRIALGEDAPGINVDTQSATRKRLYDKDAVARRARSAKGKRSHAASLETPHINPPPGYPLFLRMVYGIFGKAHYRAVFVIQALLSTLAVTGMYYVGMRVGGKPTGLVAAAIAAVYPNFIIYNLTTLTESLSLLIVVLLMAVLVHPSSERRRSTLASLVLLAGCAFRPPFLYFWPGIFVGIKKKTVYVVVTALIVVPVVVTGLATGRSSNRPALAFYKSYNEKATGVRGYEMRQTRLGRRDLSSRTYIEGAVDFIKDNKWKTLDIIYAKGAVFVSRGWDSFVMERLVPEEGGIRKIVEYAWIPVMLTGIVGMLRFRKRDGRMLFLMTMSYVICILALAIFKVRYRLMIEPMMIVYSAMLLTSGRKR